jgi:2-polyprenyl-3-methyl-5-hydroxy-6-metoxy-1,4-benzoquinol methylase
MTVTLKPSQPEVRLQLEYVTCSLCGCNDSKRLHTERYELAGDAVELGVNRCALCKLVYVSPRLTPTATKLVYELDATDTISHNYCWEGEASERRFDGLLRRLHQHNSGGQLLDVGCGGGHFLRAAKRHGNWRVVGIEPVASAAIQAAQLANCEVHHSTLEDAPFAAGSFDVVSMLGVLEHVHEPLHVLRAARRLLTDCGHLAIYVPNYYYLRLKDTGPYCYIRSGNWSRLHPQEHLHHFTPKTLGRVLDKCGFEVVHLDMGRPFTSRSLLKQALKQAAFKALIGIKAATGVHLGGIEVIARPKTNAASKLAN